MHIFTFYLVKTDFISRLNWKQNYIFQKLLGVLVNSKLAKGLID